MLARSRVLPAPRGPRATTLKVGTPASSVLVVGGACCRRRQVRTAPTTTSSIATPSGRRITTAVTLFRSGRSSRDTPDVSYRHGVQGDDAGTLVRLAADGDESAWSALVRRFSGLVWSVARSHNLGGADAEEVFQTTWLRLTEHVGRLKEPEQIGRA